MAESRNLSDKSKLFIVENKHSSKTELGSFLPNSVYFNIMDYKHMKLILLECPLDIQLFLDNLELKVGELFKGIKNIPAGPHYLSYRSIRGRSGHFLSFSKDSQVQKWDQTLHEFCPVDSETEQLILDQHEELVCLLVEYPQESYRQWRAMTSYVSPQLIHRLEAPTTDTDELGDSNCSFAYVIVPKRKHNSQMTHAQITQLNFDKTSILEDILADCSIEDLLGEFQFAYISFLLGESPESFAHWKELLILLCNCEEALYTRPTLFSKFILVLYTQLGSLPTDIFFDPFLGESFIPSCLNSLLSLLEEPLLHPSLSEKGCKLRRYVQKTFGVLEVFDPEEAPAIVETIATN